MPYLIGYARNQHHNNLIHNEMAYDKEIHNAIPKTIPIPTLDKANSHMSKDNFHHYCNEEKEREDVESYEAQGQKTLKYLR
ncbi:hypothetical protein JHK86_047991 [Glycine max]|nr:hypothetical protein JHK86_047991 [Glycine max]